MKRQSNEMLLILSILKKPEKEMNANSLAESLAISSMGALKIAKKLESKGILLSKKIGNANILKINFGNDYAVQYVKLMLKKEAEEANYFVKRWISELRKINVPSVLYGSVINKKEPNDIDILLIIEKNQFSKVKKQINEINLLNVKKIHPLYQTKEDLIKSIEKEDKVILNAIKGIVINGEDLFIDIIKEVN